MFPKDLALELGARVFQADVETLRKETDDQTAGSPRTTHIEPETMNTTDKKQREAIKFLKDHFPDREPWDGDVEFFLTREFLLAGNLSATVSLKEETEKLDRFGKAISDAWSIYSSMSLRTKTAMTKVPSSSDRSAREGVPDRTPVELRKPGYESTRENLLRELISLHRAVLGYNPRNYQDLEGTSRDPGMIKTAKLELAKLLDLNPQARANEHDQKIHFADAARRLWKRYTGNEAPLKSDGPFLKFLDDLVVFAGVHDAPGWSSESIMSAWEKSKRQ
ncbi:hypothetical protein [Tropicimonas aquimaris]|uniref:Uncharacterized protein n=1 Tax=Tropicimonas aquimaris TaxID=914152 RepID=A0ABW3IT02_9RHOB